MNFIGIDEDLIVNAERIAWIQKIDDGWLIIFDDLVQIIFNGSECRLIQLGIESLYAKRILQRKIVRRMSDRDLIEHQLCAGHPYQL